MPEGTRLTPRSEADGRGEVVESAQFLPGETGAAEVPVSGRAQVAGLQEVEVADDRSGTEVEHLVDRGLDLGGIDRLGAEGLDEDAHGVGDADGVGDLHLAPARRTGGDHVLGHPSGGVGGGPVNLGGVLAAEGASTVTSHAAVGVDDDLASRQSAVALRTTGHEASRRVDEDVVVIVGELLRDHRGDDLLDHVRPDNRVAVDAVLVLGAQHDVADRDGHTVLVLEGDLGLAVGAQVGHLTVVADVGESLGQPMGGPDRQRHEIGGLVAGEPEHHPLVAGSLAVEVVLDGVLRSRLLGGVDALGDVTALVVDRDDHPAGVTVETGARVVVSDVLEGLADDARDLDVGRGGDLPGHHAQTGGHHGLAGDATTRVLGEDLE